MLQLANIQIRGFSQSKSDFSEFLQQSVIFVDLGGRRQEAGGRRKREEGY
jgi:hypothetical protein